MIRHGQSVLKLVALNEHFSTNRIISVGFLFQNLVVGLMICRLNARVPAETSQKGNNIDELR